MRLRQPEGVKGTNEAMTILMTLSPQMRSDVPLREDEPASIVRRDFKTRPAAVHAVITAIRQVSSARYAASHLEGTTPGVAHRRRPHSLQVDGSFAASCC